MQGENEAGDDVQRAGEPSGEDHQIDSAGDVQIVDDHYDPAHTKKIYASASEQLQRWVKELWERYCCSRGKEPLDTLKLFPIDVLYNFFHWILEERRGRIRKARTVQTYWNTLTLVRELETGIYDVPPSVQKQMCGTRQYLVAEFGLKTAKEAKPIMRAEDEFELLKTLWESPHMNLQHERQRVQLALMLQLAGITGNRPGALRRLQYKNLKIALLPDPSGGQQPRLIVEFQFEHTKRFLGAKDANTFPVPDIPHESCLLLCPQITLLGLAFADDAFAVPALTPDQLFSLRIPDGRRELIVPIKTSMAEVALFRRADRAVQGVEISREMVQENWLRERLRRLGEITGFEAPVKPYCFRRGHGEALDSSSHISDSQRNLILQHSSSAGFQHNYLSRYITQDTQAAYRGLEPQTAMIRVASGMSRSIDPHRPRSLTDAQLKKVNQHPEVILARRVRDRMAKQVRSRYTTINRSRGTSLHSAYQEAQRKYLSTKRTVHKETITRLKMRYQEEQPTTDIIRQLHGNVDREWKRVLLSETPDTLSVERRAALAALFAFAPSNAAHDCRRRSGAIAVVAALCKRQEPPAQGVCRDQTTVRNGPSSMDQPVSFGSDLDDNQQDPFPTRCLPTQCIFCMGASELPLVQRTKSFRDRDGLKRHFERKHLRHLQASQSIQCPHPKCNDVWLEHTNHLQHQAAALHGTVT